MKKSNEAWTEVDEDGFVNEDCRSRSNSGFCMDEGVRPDLRTKQRWLLDMALNSREGVVEAWRGNRDKGRIWQMA